MSIADNILTVQTRVAAAARRAGRRPENVTLVAISKGHPASAVREAYAAGQRHFGENRVQEAESKLAALPDLRPHVTWHMVGHLQTNKAKVALQLFDIIQSVDSARLGETLDAKATRPVGVFLEVNVAGEASKGGLPPDQVAETLKALSRCPNLRVGGLMTIAPLVEDREETRPVFRRLRELAEGLGLGGLSMGMTNDFEVAVEEGATIVRIGTAIFGPRTT